MAAKNTEVSLYVLPCNGGSSGTAGQVTVVTGTATTTGGSTSVTIIPGYDANTGDSLLTQGSLNIARGIKKIVRYGFTNNANSNAFKVVKSNNTTADADQLVVTCTANDTFDYWLEGVDGGQNA